MRHEGIAAVLTIALFLSACGDPCEEKVDRDFLAKAAAEEGAIQTESGLVYKVLKSGYGPKPEAGDRVTVHYKGMLADGTVFDSSLDRSPVRLSLEQVIPGWAEGLQMMKGGGMVRLVVPPHLGYGRKGHLPKIPSCAVLVFEIELFGIEGG